MKTQPKIIIEPDGMILLVEQKEFSKENRKSISDFIRKDKAKKKVLKKPVFKNHDRNA